MLNALLVALGAMAVGTVLWRALTRRDGQPNLSLGLRKKHHEATRSALWLQRFERIQVTSIIVAIASVPAGFAVLVLTGDGILTIVIVSAIPVAGLLFGICELAKGFIEARDIIDGGMEK